MIHFYKLAMPTTQQVEMLAYLYATLIPFKIMFEKRLKLVPPAGIEPTFRV